MSDESDDEGPGDDDFDGRMGQSQWQAQFASTASLTSLAAAHPRDQENNSGFDADVWKRMLSEHTLSHDVFPQTMQPDKWLWISSRCDTLPGGLSVWKAIVKQDTLFVDATCFDQLSDQEFRTTLLALLELAEDVLHSASIVMCVPRSNTQSSDLVRAFMYAGFELVHPGTYRHSPNYLLVGYEI
ncbi:hypothetical protein IWQ62_006300 [Dispira parvispora]|uniref:Ornithine decarboxylase antizyme n=1 Tax=Dispira parvispora TaxID=1520584 RepID=A0A9W8APH3_9FUNG|nr:hypothetical protein IWQ62_006300 [Dispira parvispora]